MPPAIPQADPARPAFDLDAARRLLVATFGIDGTIAPLPGERDQNFHVRAASGEFTLKIGNAAELATAAVFQAALLRHLAAAASMLPVPRVVPPTSGGDGDVAAIVGPTGERHAVWLVTFLPGAPLARVARTPQLLHQLGCMLGRLARALGSFGHAGAHRDFAWHIRRVPDARTRLQHVRAADRRALLESWLAGFDERVVPAFVRLRHQVIHNDANDWNVLVDTARGTVAGIIDWGDAVFAPLVVEPAIACAYAMLGQADPVAAAAAVVAGYHAEMPLTDQETDLLLDLIAGRLCTSVTMSAMRHSSSSDPYLFVSEVPAWELLERLARLDRSAFAASMRRACRRCGAGAGRDAGQLLAARRRYLGKNLSLAYREPLHLVRGEDVWLIDASGRRYLDCYNNVAHVGHCHPRVVTAMTAQAATLNTNSRYLHENVIAYAERLAGTLPPGLDCFYFCNSGSEANDLALRIARTVTGRQDLAVLEWAYHGHTEALIEASPWKYRRKGGQGRAPFVHELPLPDPYRAPGDWPAAELGRRYGEQARARLRDVADGGRSLAAFLAETIPSVGGQVFLPEGYLRSIYAAVRATGGLCIADEVQVGFGRVGTGMWAFTEHGVVPDIVTMGKPVGAGHPLAVLATTQAIAQAFANGMEYFNTFGGNPVSCAVGLAVLDVLEDEQLLANAREQGDYLLQRLRQLAGRHAAIGDVRGRGLFLGIEVVKNRGSKEHDGASAAAVVDAARDFGVLVGTDGPFDNVIKLRPPMTFRREHADLLLAALDRAFAQVRPVG